MLNHVMQARNRRSILGRPAVMVSAILAAGHRTFVLVVTSLFVLFVFPMHNKFLLLLLLLVQLPG